LTLAGFYGSLAKHAWMCLENRQFSPRAGTAAGPAMGRRVTLGRRRHGIVLASRFRLIFSS
jgi:hypothetical protein